MSGHLPDVPLSATAGATPTLTRDHVDEVPSFDEVYEAHFPFVWRSIRRLGIDSGAVDDVAQDVFLVVHRRLGDFEGRSSVKSWLFGILLRIVRDHRRTLRRKPAGRDPEDPDGVSDDAARGPHESAAKAEAVRLLHSVLDTMTDEKREVFVLAELEQMTVPEIAEAIGANVNTTYSKLRAARADFDEAIARAHARDGWRLK